MTQMNIHEALAKVKMYEKRINREIENSTFVELGLKSAETINNVDKKDIKKNLKAEYQSISDMIEERNKLKKAIIMSNAVTEIQIAGKKYTVAEAIELKSSINLKKKLVDELEEQFDDNKNKVDRLNEKAKKEALELTKEILRGENQDSKKEEYIDNYLRLNEHEVILGFDVKKKIDELYKEISDFEAQVDFALSTSNALTTIEI